jgi:endonuclease YncB( thermonuclease family)
MGIWFATILGIGILLSPSTTYRADLIRVIDGDTAWMVVHDWIDVEARVRLRGIDAAELHAKCASEYQRAIESKHALARLLASGSISLSDVGVDRYLGRIDARVSTRSTPDVSAALLKGGFARRYDGGRRQPWC